MPFIFEQGPLGRNLVIDANGAIIVNTNGGQFLPYYTGPQGRPITVDGSGRLHVSLVAPFGQFVGTAVSGSLDLGSSTNFDIMLDSDITFTQFTTPPEGAKVTFIFEQATSGGFNVTWPSNVRWRDGVAPTLTSGSGFVDLVSMVFRGRDDTFLADYGLNFS